MPVYTLEDLNRIIGELFELSDEELIKAKPVIIQELTNSFSGPTVGAAIDDYLRQCDLAGFSPDTYAEDLQNSQTFIYNAICELKEQYADSPIKQELLDIFYSLMESYIDLTALKAVNRETMNLGVELIRSDAKIPTYAHEGDQGADVYAPEANLIPAGARGHLVHTGIKLLIPHGWAVSIRPRSGMSKNTSLRISNSPATIDQQYRGEICILFDNLSDEPYEIKQGDRIAQLILEKNYQAAYTQVDTVEPDTDRGEGGFGSSGN